MIRFRRRIRCLAISTENSSGISAVRNGHASLEALTRCKSRFIASFQRSLTAGRCTRVQPKGNHMSHISTSLPRPLKVTCSCSCSCSSSSSSSSCCCCGCDRSQTEWLFGSQTIESVGSLGYLYLTFVRTS